MDATDSPGADDAAGGRDDGTPATRGPARPPGSAADGEEHGRLASRIRHRLRREPGMSDEQVERRVSAQFAQQWSQHWAQVRAERRREEQEEHEVPEIRGGTSNFSRAHVPWGVDLAAAWAWRFLVIVAAGYLIARTVGFFSLVVLPLVIALFIAALVTPLVNAMANVIPRGLAAFLTLVSVIAVVALMVTFATQQVVAGANDLSSQVVDGLDKIRAWLQTGPLHASDKQINDAISGTQDLVTQSSAELVKRATEVGATVGHIVAALFIVLFATYFFLADGRRIWAWAVRLFPRVARPRADASGRVAWLSLTQFVRATVLVALTDALGIMAVAAVLKLPFVMAIGVLVFLGAFVPMVGATISGSVAVLVALVAQGPFVALLMLGGVIAVQQLEAHVLQPFLMGRMVSVHPLGVILAVACGVLLAGIPGALVAVPLAASVNAVVVYLASAPPEDEERDGTADVEERDVVVEPGPA